MKHFVNFLVEQYDRQHRVDDFVNFACDMLKVDKPKIILLNDREPNMTTASYNMNTKEVKICIKGRAVFDICRSIAHELVHHAQHKMTDDVDGSTGSPHEDEANALAGRIVRLYGKKHPEFYDETE